MTPPKQPAWGGARPGAGRPTPDGVKGTVKVDVTLDEATIDKAIRIGDGKLSVGLRRAVKAYRKR